MKRIRRIVLLCCLLVASVIGAQTPALPRSFAGEPGMRRFRTIKLDRAKTGAAVRFDSSMQSADGRPAPTTFDMFPDVSLSVDWQKVDHLDNGRTLLWSGTVAGAPWSNASLAVTGDVVTASISRGDGLFYQIRTAEDGTEWLLEFDQSRFFENDEPIPSARVPRESDLRSFAETANDDSSTIDVMVLYTPAARRAALGTTQMEQLVRIGIAETNQAYGNSGVNQRVRLVYSGEMDYVESGSSSTDLNNLRTNTEIRTLRNTYGADLVSLWEETMSDAAGRGYLLDPDRPREDLGFSVLLRTYATGYYTFGHEMGHNMGAHHAKDDVNSDGSVPKGAYPYSNGYKHVTAPKFRTIMAYDNNCLCPRIQYFSNPNAMYNGFSAGIDSNASDSAANYLTLNNTARIVANFRATVVGTTTGPDTTAPLVTITSHTNGQTVLSTSITISGTATDAARGDSGISSVTVNGVRASNDTATAANTAAWSRTLTLNSGVNTITIVARDNSPNQNSSTATLSITVNIPVSVTASSYHVFPQFADGLLDDGSFYRTTLMVANTSSSATADCTFRLYGLTVNDQNVFPFTYAGGGWTVSPISSTQKLRSGYATLQCSANVEAQLLYSYYSAAGTKVSEATVFSSPPAGLVQVLGDNRGGSQIAIAIANDSDVSTTYTITPYDNLGKVVPGGSTTRTLLPRTSLAAFVRDLVALPADYYGQVYVTSGGGKASMIGIRFTGNAFTTIPAVNRSAVGPTAATYHVFPQFADGKARDGSFYRTTVMIVNSSNESGTCTLRLYGLTVNGYSAFTYGTFTPGMWSITTSISSTQTLASGYAVLQCQMPVEAQLLYSFYSASGGKISEATVFSSPPAGNVQVLADNREASSLAIAIANDSDQDMTYTITALDRSGNPAGTIGVPIAARRSIARFLSDLIPLPANHYGPVLVTSKGSASLIGIRFTGGIFTTIPESVR
jgi:peptidyl-Asp metalloendopeptidase